MSDSIFDTEGVVLESLACATPVIATKVCGIPEVVAPPARLETRAVAETLGGLVSPAT
jgi:glycosyltransferase involved in cell wall biosynthesis